MSEPTKNGNGQASWKVWRKLIGFVLAGVGVGLVAFYVAYRWFNGRSLEPGSYDVVRSAVAATGVITVGAGAAVALLRQKLNEDNAERAERAHQLALDNLKLAQDNMALSQSSVKATLKKLELEHDANRTDRYTKAVEQLGSDSIHVRLGGIYALKRLADDSERDLPMIVEVLAAFVRATASQAEPDDIEIRAALTALGRIGSVGSCEPADLANAYLGKRDLSSLDLTHVSLEGANLTDANLSQANLTGVVLNSANLTRAKLDFANLTDVDLNCAVATDADFYFADLSRALLNIANLTGTQLVCVDFTGAVLAGAKLSGADLTHAKLQDADLAGVNWDALTRWPDDLEPPASVPHWYEAFPDGLLDSLESRNREAEPPN